MLASLPTVSPSVTHVPPAKPTLTIISRRATFKGIQSIVSGQFSEEIVTLKPDNSFTCTCGLAERHLYCPHIPHVQAQEQAYRHEASHRQAYCSSFSIYEV